MEMRLGVRNWLPLMQTVLVETNVSENPNFITISWTSVIDFDHVSISVGKARYTYTGM